VTKNPSPSLYLRDESQEGIVKYEVMHFAERLILLNTVYKLKFGITIMESSDFQFCCQRATYCNSFEILDPTETIFGYSYKSFKCLIKFLIEK
jgi:hypothetical protein